MSDNSLRVLHITSRSDFGGGPEHLYQQILLQKSEINLFVAAPKQYPYFNKFRDITGEKNICRIDDRSFSIFDLIKLKNFVRKNKINLIHSHGKGAGLYSRLLTFFLGIKTIHTLHGFHYEDYSYFLRKLYFLYEILMSKITAKIICVSQNEKNILLKKRICGENKITVITNGVCIPDSCERKSDRMMKVITQQFNYQKIDFYFKF